MKRKMIVILIASFLLFAQTSIAQLASGSVNIRTLAKGATPQGNPTSHVVDADTTALAVILKGTNSLSIQATATFFGTASLESPAGTKLVTLMHAGTGITILPQMDFTEPVPIVSGVVIRVVCTPSSTTSYTWQANFGGYER